MRLNSKIYVWKKRAISSAFQDCIYPVKWVERARLDGLLAPFPVLIHNGARLPRCLNQVTELGWCFRTAANGKKRRIGN